MHSSTEAHCTHRIVHWPDMERLPHTRALWASPPEASSRPERARLLVALSEALHTALTERQREAVELYFFEGLSEAAIARRLGISQQVVHRRIHGAHRGGRRIGGALARLRLALTPQLEAR